ncbi:MAG: hypothetical protein JWN08_2285 [Frankiales bacterium]|nr:hypothetical protein [Frankiales bacterium]
MRVLVVSAWEPWRRGDGACLVLHAHLRELADRHEVVLLSAGAPARRVAPPTLPVPARWYGRPLPAPADVVLRRLASRVEPAHVAYVERPDLLRDLQHELDARRPDVLHLFGWGTAALQRFSNGVPTIHDAVDPWAANLANRARSPLGRLLDAGQAGRVGAHEARHYPRLGAVVVRSDEDAALLQAQVPAARVRVVPNGVDLPADGAPTDEPVLAFLGAYDAASNVAAARSLVQDVLPLVRQRVPDARALLVGRDPTPELRALDAEVTGTVPDVAAALRRAAVLVAPMTSGLGVKNKVLEAMAAGLPVVATPLAVQGVGASEGVLVGTGPAELAELAAGLLLDPVRRRALGAANRRRAQNTLTWAHSADRLEGVWSECASTS